MVVKMNKLKNSKIILLAIILISLILITGCNNKTENLSQKTGNVITNLETDERIINVDQLEIVNFHATNRCYTCITAGAYAKETVETYFQNELKYGIIKFKEIDALQPENREITLKYGPTSSSVWIGVYKGNTFSAEEDTNIWYKLRNKQDFMLYLKGEIENKLAGN
jgi:hypothetical protein